MLGSAFANSPILRSPRAPALGPAGARALACKTAVEAVLCLIAPLIRRAFSTAHGGASSGKFFESRRTSTASSLRNKFESDQSGQAMIEFIMLIPLIMAFIWYMVHVNLAINKSIVGQKHARSQLFLKLYNHRSGPVTSEFGRSDRSHFYIGVAADPMQASSSAAAPTEILGIGIKPEVKSTSNDDPGDAEPGSLRQRVRVRTAFGICTHRKRLKDGSGLTDFCGSVPSGSD